MLQNKLLLPLTTSVLLESFGMLRELNTIFVTARTDWAEVADAGWNVLQLVQRTTLLHCSAYSTTIEKDPNILRTNFINNILTMTTDQIVYLQVSSWGVWKIRGKFMILNKRTWYYISLSRKIWHFIFDCEIDLFFG